MHRHRPASLSEAARQLREFIRDSMESFRGSAAVNPAFAQRVDLLALDLFALQFEANEVYRRFCGARGISPEKVQHWTEVPFLPVAAFKELECTSLPVPDRTRAFHSSGTTQARPSRHFHNEQSLESYEASILPWFNRHVMPGIEGWRGRLFGGPLEPPDFLFLTPSPALAPNSSLAYMFEVIRREHAPASTPFCGRVARDRSWFLDMTGVQNALAQAVDFLRPLTILGTAFSLVELADHLLGTNKAVVLPEGSTVMETGGYKGRSRSMPKAELYALITRALGIPDTHVVSEYGMSELSSQAYDHIVPDDPEGAPHREWARPSVRVFHFPPWVRTRIISPETGGEVSVGEAGILQVLDLANIFSASAVQTEDLARRTVGGFEWAGRAALAEPRGCSLNQLNES